MGINEDTSYVSLSLAKYNELYEKAKKYDELRTSEAKCNTEEANNTENIERIEIKKITKEEMGEIFDMLKNKMLGGKNNG